MDKPTDVQCNETYCEYYTNNNNCKKCEKTCEFLYADNCVLFQLGKYKYLPKCRDNINCKTRQLQIAINTLEKICIGRYYLPQTIAEQALIEIRGMYE